MPGFEVFNNYEKTEWHIHEYPGSASTAPR